MLRILDVEKKLNVSRQTLYRLLENKEFPEPYRITETTLRWKESVIDEWLESRRDQPKE